MGAGVQVWAQDGSGVAQIDADAGAPNLQLVAKHSVVTTSDWEVSGIASSSVTDVLSLGGAVDPVIAVRCTGGAAAVFWMGSTQFQLITNGGVGSPITAYVFARPTPAAQHVFQAWNAAGDLVFDAALPAMRVRAQYATASLGTLGTLPAGRTYAAVVTAGLSRNFQAAGPNNWLRYDLRAGVQFATATANRVDLIGILFDFESSSSSGSSIPMNQAQVLVLDVTDL